MYSISIVVPMHNEEHYIVDTLLAITAAVDHFDLQQTKLGSRKIGVCEIVIVDDASTDGSVARVQELIQKVDHGSMKLVSTDRMSVACARNDGAAAASGDVLVFVDADTHVPVDALLNVSNHVGQGKEVGICRYGSTEPSLRAWCWWTFWNHVRELPLAYAKAMPAFMFCTRNVFTTHGPFDESVFVGEEWPILAGSFRERRSAFVYDRQMVVRSSSRRMANQRFGYFRTFGKWVWAVLHVSGRRNYRADIR